MKARLAESRPEVACSLIRNFLNLARKFAPIEALKEWPLVYWWLCIDPLFPRKRGTIASEFLKGLCSRHKKPYAKNLAHYQDLAWRSRMEKTYDKTEIHHQPERQRTRLSARDPRHHHRKSASRTTNRQRQSEVGRSGREEGGSSDIAGIKESQSLGCTSWGARSAISA